MLTNLAQVFEKEDRCDNKNEKVQKEYDQFDENRSLRHLESTHAQNRHSYLIGDIHDNNDQRRYDDTKDMYLFVLPNPSCITLKHYL